MKRILSEILNAFSQKYLINKIAVLRICADACWRVLQRVAVCCSGRQMQYWPLLQRGILIWDLCVDTVRKSLCSGSIWATNTSHGSEDDNSGWLWHKLCQSLKSQSAMKKMITFIIINSGLVPLIEGLCAQIYDFRFQIFFWCIFDVLILHLTSKCVRVLDGDPRYDLRFLFVGVYDQKMSFDCCV